MSPDEIKRKVEDLQKRYSSLLQTKAGLEGEIKARKEELAKVVQEIRAAGYDPKLLVQERDRAKRELEEMIVKYEGELAEVEKAFASFNKK
jgi:uncharacterized protein (UPF0335 family)